MSADDIRVMIERLAKRIRALETRDVAAGGAGGGHTIQDEGANLTARTRLNFTGAGVTASDNAGTSTTDVTIPGAGANDASDVTFTPAVLADWDGSADPGNADAALDQLAERVADIELPGGGATVSMWCPDAPPASPSAYDDEFDNNSVAAAWTEFDPLNTLTVSETAEGLVLSGATHANDQFIGLYKPIPAGNFTITVRVALSGLKVNYLRGGLGLWEDPADVTKRLHIGMLGKDGSGSGFAAIIEKWNAYNSWNSTVVSISANYGPTHGYLRWRRTGTTYTFCYCHDGMSWQQLWQGTPDFTPTAYGPIINNVNTGDTLRAVYSFFRYNNSDVGLNGVLYGRRVRVLF